MYYVAQGLLKKRELMTRRFSTSHQLPVCLGDAPSAGMRFPWHCGLLTICRGRLGVFRDFFTKVRTPSRRFEVVTFSNYFICNTSAG